MDTTTFQTRIDEHLRSHSGLEQKRDYLGISAIGKCPRQVVRDFLYGKGELSMEAHQNCYGGYMFERDVMSRLQEAGIARSVNQYEVVATFDPRLRGHVDGETIETEPDLVEVKSLNRRKFETVKQTHMALNEHFAQVQLYMHYGPWRTCWIVYVCRETLEHHVVKVGYLQRQAIKFEMKAQRMLDHIDGEMLPACECKYCRD